MAAALAYAAGVEDAHDALHKTSKYDYLCTLYGLKQHKGECWHDALSTVFLFTDGIKEIIQYIFRYPIQEILSKITHNIRRGIIPEYYLPINIEEKDLDLFLKNIYEYIKELHFIFNNIKQYEDAMKVSDDESDNNSKNEEPATKKVLHLPRIQRQPSRDESIKCTQYIYNLYNINRLPEKKKEFDPNSHGGGNMQFLIQLNIINYTFMNYFRNEKPVEYLYAESIDFNFYLQNISTNFTNIVLRKNYISLLILHLERLIRDILPNTLGVNINCINIYKRAGDSHAQSFISCDNVDYFYDNNGVDDKNTLDFHEGIDDLQTTMKFPWREYLNNKFSSIIKYLKENFMDDSQFVGDNRELKIFELSILLNSISDFYNDHISFDNNGNILKGKIGRNYLNKFYIFNLDFILKSNEINEMDYNLKNIKYINFIERNRQNYINDKIIKINTSFTKEKLITEYGYNIFNFPEYIIKNPELLEKEIIAKNLLDLNLHTSRYMFEFFSEEEYLEYYDEDRNIIHELDEGRKSYILFYDEIRKKIGIYSYLPTLRRYYRILPGTPPGSPPPPRTPPGSPPPTSQLKYLKYKKKYLNLLKQINLSKHNI